MMKVLKKALTALKKKAAKAVKQVARHLRRRRPANPGASTEVATVDGAGRPVVPRSPEPHSSVDLSLPWATTTSGSWIIEAAAVTPILISVQVCPLLYGTFGACQPCHTPSWYASQLDRIMNADHVVPICTFFGVTAIAGIQVSVMAQTLLPSSWRRPTARTTSRRHRPRAAQACTATHWERSRRVRSTSWTGGPVPRSSSSGMELAGAPL